MNFIRQFLNQVFWTFTFMSFISNNANVKYHHFSWVKPTLRLSLNPLLPKYSWSTPHSFSILRMGWGVSWFLTKLCGLHPEGEVKWALGSITMNKASGGDGIPVELFQILNDDAVKVLHSICQQIWKTPQWPQDWKRSIFISIPKKGNAKECSTTAQLHSSHMLAR